MNTQADYYQLGEANASWIMQGVIEFLTGPSEKAKLLCDNYVFKIVPMLNPDGVFNGNNRMDSLGQNLNRFYHLPDL